MRQRARSFLWTMSVLLLSCTTTGSVLTPRDPDESALALTAVRPALGPSAGGITVELEGQGFAPGASVRVAGTPVLESSVLSPTRLTVTLPPRPGRSARCRWW
jgi:hypothetical protein